ncbi:MAG TPA: TetR/AcrR family transcriptional regulator [Mycobacteriales bacterium]|nr:TetR/AcrR family transcriptional regulator [Mycobacteriales bacterium]
MPGRVDEVRARARGRRRGILGVDVIVDRALEIVDTEGVQAVSMRRVAAELDTGPASLYAHVANKEELLRLVLDRILDEVEIPTGDDWQDVIRSLAHNARAVLQRHNDAAVLSFAHIPTGRNSLESVERVLATMLAGGVPPQVAAWSMDIVSLYVAADVYEGWLLQQRFDDGSGRDPEVAGQELVAEVTATFADLPPDRFPYLTGNLPVLMTGSSDDRFAFGIDMLIAGFASRISPRPSAPPSETP